MRKKTQDAGNGEQGTGDREWQISRRGVFGALAAVAAAVAGMRRERRETVVEKRRRRRFWIGHT
jgi:hypothetical protein